MPIDDIDHRLLDAYQRDFPLEPRPFAKIAADLGIAEAEVIEQFAALRDTGKITRIGAIVRPNSIGASTLAALCVPAEEVERIAALVCAHGQVNHCYEREHAINLWFVVTAANRPAVDGVLRAIEAETGLACLDLPIVEAYHIDLGFALS
ncbi:MAG: AsnC family transcriptional regulator [Defluviicoccus sp.]|nr:AsnC family transcriptional regulator [Defluviicoccus sp.]MDG4608121.1 AsnC family transcriptional regulator [Defluviicoccus sp.]